MKTVYHGSPNNFTAFEIKEELVQRGSHNLAEGLGVYMTEDSEMAANYGPYLYTLEVSENEVTDFTDPEVVRTVLDNVFKEIDVDQSLLDEDMLVDMVLSGNISVTKLHKEISDLLDSKEQFYNRYQDRITYEDDCLLASIEPAYSKNIKHILKYYDMSFDAPIYVCIRKPETLRIVSVTQKEDSL